MAAIFVIEVKPKFDNQVLSLINQVIAQNGLTRLSKDSQLPIIYYTEKQLPPNNIHQLAKLIKTIPNSDKSISKCYYSPSLTKV